ncbi:hypothetical protein LCGC14_1183140 [marine sediment metagenome]|uniref:Uncharacterized protein n=1 Tax=marine sediment metagenome TaxID=412755 RepID=A0A0F9LRD4_9ZZZZ
MFDYQLVSHLVDYLLKGELKKADFLTELERIWPPVLNQLGIYLQKMLVEFGRH